MINTKESSERSTDAFTQDYNWWQEGSRGESIRCDELDLQSGIGCAQLLFMTNWPCQTLGISLTINTWWQKRCWGRLHFIITGSRRTGTQTHRELFHQIHADQSCRRRLQINKCLKKKKKLNTHTNTELLPNAAVPLSSTELFFC